MVIRSKAILTAFADKPGHGRGSTRTSRMVGIDVTECVIFQYHKHHMLRRRDPTLSSGCPVPVKRHALWTPIGIVAHTYCRASASGRAWPKGYLQSATGACCKARWTSIGRDLEVTRIHACKADSGDRERGVSGIGDGLGLRR